MPFEPRFYRNNMNRERFRFFNIIKKETDLWIGVSHINYQKEIEDFTENQVNFYRSCIENHILENPDFLNSMSPISAIDEAPEIIKLMLYASSAASVGPMAAVAGALSEMIGKDILKKFNPEELIVENGGDIFLSIKNKILIQFYAGKNKNFDKLGISIPSEGKYLGICTSSGNYGHALSFGKADSVTVICESAAYADAWATAICNNILEKEDIHIQLEKFRKNKEILSLIAVKDDKMGISGNIKLEII